MINNSKKKLRYRIWNAYWKPSKLKINILSWNYVKSDIVFWLIEDHVTSSLNELVNRIPLRFKIDYLKVKSQSFELNETQNILNLLNYSFMIWHASYSGFELVLAVLLLNAHKMIGQLLKVDSLGMRPLVFRLPDVSEHYKRNKRY